MNLSTVLSSLNQGLCYAIVALGVYISYKILDFPDLTVDGTFPLGAVISVMLIRGGMSPIFAIIISMLCGGIAGFVTGFLHVKFNISNLLSGILVMTALLSITLNIGRVDNLVSVSIRYNAEHTTLFNGGLMDSLSNFFMPILGVASKGFVRFLILLVVVIICKIIMDLYLNTQSGMMLRATGNNPQLITSMGKNNGYYKILGLVIANSLVALSGSIYSQYEGYYSNGSGTGMVVIALASVIIGWSMFKNVNFIKKTTAVIIGAIIYSACLSVAILIGIDTNYLKLVMAVIFTVVLILGERKKHYKPIVAKHIKADALQNGGDNA